MGNHTKRPFPEELFDFGIKETDDLPERLSKLREGKKRVLKMLHGLFEEMVHPPKEANQESWSEKKKKYLDKYYLWLDESEMRYEDEEEEAIAAVALCAAEEESLKLRNNKLK